MRRQLSTDSNNFTEQNKRMRATVDKKQLYDRQLRLWQESGQTALETSRVVVFGSSALAAETLKNLVLPGIGEFVVVDDAVVEEDDWLTNFFVSEPENDEQRRSRAQCIVQGLCELNPNVQGSAIVSRSALDLLQDRAASHELLASASLVISCRQTDNVISELSKQCWELNVPLIATDSAGFYANMRISVAEHPVVESHIEQPPDLRLTCPFPALIEHAKTIDLETLDSTQLAHVPFAIIIMKALDQWSQQQQEGGADVSKLTFAQRKQVRQIIAKMAPTSTSSSLDEENFEQARDSANKQCLPYEIPAPIRDILKEARTKSIKQMFGSNGGQFNPQVKFWLLVKALNAFVDSDYSGGKLPLNEGIPDMKADTKGYIALQHVYKQRANEDKEQLIGHVQDVVGAAELPSDMSISAEEVGVFCKNVSRLRLLRFTPLHDWAKVGEQMKQKMEGFVGDDDKLSVGLYGMFAASNVFWSRHGRYPGSGATDAGVAEDARELAEIARELLVKQWGAAEDAVDTNLALEFARSGHCELHNIASMMGGIVSQEAIKLITHQYVPEGTFTIMDGVKSKTHLLKV